MTGAIVRDKVAAEDLLRASDLDRTVVHAVRLTNGAATEAAKPVPEEATLKMGHTASRADVAGILLAAATNENATRGSVALAS